MPHLHVDAQQSPFSGGLVKRFTGLRSENRQNAYYEASPDARGPTGLRVQHEPRDPYVEFVFVHGFPGGSHKTWTYNNDPRTFWPKEWLPHDRDFSQVRIHTFGYDGDWSDHRGDISKIKHFGKLLLDSMANNSFFRKNDPVRVYVLFCSR